MSERVLDSSDERRTLVLVVALRVLRDPVLALDASNEALATRRPLRMTWPRSSASGKSSRRLGRDGRVPSVERRRHRTGLDIVQVGPELRAELHALGACRLARGGEPLALAEEVMRIVARLERDAPTIQVLGSIASSGLVVALADRSGRPRWRLSCRPSLSAALRVAPVPRASPPCGPATSRCDVTPCCATRAPRRRSPTGGSCACCSWSIRPSGCGCARRRSPTGSRRATRRAWIRSCSKTGSRSSSCGARSSRSTTRASRLRHRSGGAIASRSTSRPPVA